MSNTTLSTCTWQIIELNSKVVNCSVSEKYARLKTGKVKNCEKVIDKITTGHPT